MISASDSSYLIHYIQVEIMNLLLAINRERQTTCIMVQPAPCPVPARLRIILFLFRQYSAAQLITTPCH
jgi:hypothetical protein